MHGSRGSSVGGAKFQPWLRGRHDTMHISVQWSKENVLARLGAPEAGAELRTEVDWRVWLMSKEGI